MQKGLDGRWHSRHPTTVPKESLNYPLQLRGIGCYRLKLSAISKDNKTSSDGRTAELEIDMDLPRLLFQAGARGNQLSTPGLIQAQMKVSSQALKKLAHVCQNTHSYSLFSLHPFSSQHLPPFLTIIHIYTKIYTRTVT